MNSLVSNYASDSDSNADSETGVWEEDAIRSQGTVAKLQHTNQATASSLNNNLPVKSLIINNNNNNNNTSTINKSSQKRKREGPVKITLKDLGQQSDEEEYQSDDDDDAQARSSKNKKPADAAGLLGFLPAPKNPSASNQSNSVSSDGIRSKGGVASGDVASSFLNLPQPKSTPMSTIPTSSAFLVPRNLTRDKSTSKKQSLPPSTPSLPKAIPHEEYEDLDFFNLDTTSNDPKNPKRACNNCLQEHSTHGSSNQSTTTPSLNPGVAVHPSTLYSSVYASSSSSATQNHGVQIPVSSSSRNYYSQSATLDRGASGDPNLNPNSSGAQSYGYEYAQHEIDYDGNAIQDSDLDPELVRFCFTVPF